MTAKDCIWGANPYSGRKIIRELWMVDSIQAARSVLDRRDELIDAYLQAITYVRPDLSEQKRHEWAVERYGIRSIEVLQKFGVSSVEYLPAVSS